MSDLFCEGFNKACNIEGRTFSTLIGTDLEGYTLLQPIVAHDRSVVIKGRSLRSGDYVAMKFLTQKAFDLKPILFEQLCLEARIHFKLKSKRIVPFRRFIKSSACLVTTFLEGKTLEQFAGYGIEWILKALTLLCEPLEELHDLGYVHCDLKPNNVIIAKQKIRLMDFGFVCPIGYLDSRVISGKYSLGTVGFISPEQIEKRGCYGPQTDIFSLGCLLISLLTKRQYLNPNLLPEVIARKSREHPNIFTLEMVEFLTKCLALDPEERFRNIRELKAQLSKLI